MLDEKARSEVASVVRTGQIIVPSLAMGVTVFGGFVLQSRDVGQAAVGVLTAFALAATVASIPLSLLLARLLARNGVRHVAAGTWQPGRNQGPAPETQAGRLAAVYLSTTIVGAAVLEGVAFLALVAYMQERHFAALVAAGVLLGGLLCYFPTTGRASDWIEQQLQRMEENRWFSPRS